MLEDRDLDAALGRMSPICIEGIGVRLIRKMFMKEPLSVKGSVIAGGRYNIPGYLQEKGLPIAGALYVARDIEIAMTELGTDLEQSKKVDPESLYKLISFRISYKLDGVLDLTNSSNLSILKTSYQELTGNWREANEEYEIVPTQMLGLAVMRSNQFNVIKCHSAQTSRGNNYNLAIFIAEVNEIDTIDRDGIYLKAEEFSYDD